MSDVYHRVQAVRAAVAALTRYAGQTIVRGANGRIIDNVGSGETPSHGQHVRQALHDWASSASKAYIDGKGNYHIKGAGKTSGPIAPWNKAAKREFASVSDLHAAAHQAEYTVQHEPVAKVSKAAKAAAAEQRQQRQLVAQAIAKNPTMRALSEGKVVLTHNVTTDSFNNLIFVPVPQKDGTFAVQSYTIRAAKDATGKYTPHITWPDYQMAHHLLASSFGSKYPIQQTFSTVAAGMRALRAIEKAQTTTTPKVKASAKASGPKVFDPAKLNANTQLYLHGVKSQEELVSRLRDLRGILTGDIKNFTYQSKARVNSDYWAKQAQNRRKQLSQVNAYLTHLGHPLVATKVGKFATVTGLTPPKMTATNLAGEPIKGVYAKPSYAGFLERIQGNPRSKIGDGAILAPMTSVDREHRAAEDARRAGNPIYKTLMTKGEVTYHNIASDGPKTATITLRRRYHLDLAAPVYDVFMGNSKRPAKDFANLMWSPERVDAFIFTTAQDAPQFPTKGR